VATSYTDIISTSLLPDALRTIYSADLEMTATPMLIFDQFTESKNDFKADHGQTVIWTIYRQLAPSIAALSETVDVDGAQIQDFQVTFSVAEHGFAIGTTEKLNLLSYHGPISNIVNNLLAPQMASTVDILARNAFWAGAPTTYANQTSRSALTSSDVATIDIVKREVFKLMSNRVRPAGADYICVAHPAVIYDLREDSLWENAGVYSDPGRLVTGEVGRIYGVRFVESQHARLANAGAQAAQTTLTGAHAFNSSTLVVASTTGIVAGDEITLFAAANSTPDGTDATQENVIVASVTDSTHLVLQRATAIAHAGSDKVRKAVDVYPMTFLGAEKPVGKGSVLAPEVRIALKIDKLQRMSYVGWYGLFGYGTIRPWTYSVVEASASQDAKYEFGF
jgi:N4-gp56 family major capsid protein